MKSETSGWRHLYPSDASHYWQIGPNRYHYLDQGSGPVILCVHGNPTWSFYYREVVRRFSSTHRVIAIDHIGCGLSDKPARSKFDYSYATHRDNVIGLIDQLDLRDITLVAHDWGGAIGLGASIERVERISGIVLLNTAAFPPPYIPWRIGILRTPCLGTLAIRGLNAFAKPAISMAMSKTLLSADVAQGLLYPYQNWHDRVAIDSFVRDIPMLPSHPTYRALAQLEIDLARLAHLPKRLIWGMKDWCFRPECLDRFIQHWPDAEVVKLSDVGHYVIEDDPESNIASDPGIHHEKQRMTSTQSFASIKQRVKSRVDAVRFACELEVRAPKLGNVHPTARFEDCDYRDFLKAANEIAPILGCDDATLSLGDRVLLAVERTRQVTSSNVNLGIILLIAPLAMADDAFAIGHVLASITPADGGKVFESIRLASPGGMRREDVATDQDVQAMHSEPIDLMAAMQQAASRDRIALQYATEFRDFFACVVPVVRAELLRSVSIDSAIVSAQLILMSRDIDSLIARKSGIETAEEAKLIAAQCVIASERSNGQEARAQFDAWLRADGNRRNPGTTADFIAAALYWLLMDDADL